MVSFLLCKVDLALTVWLAGVGVGVGGRGQHWCVRLPHRTVLFSLG